MSNEIRFEVTHHTPGLEHYRRGWTPAAGLGLAGIWIGAVVSDDAGRRYWGVRGCDDFIPGMTHVVSPVCGFRALPDTLDGGSFWQGRDGVRFGPGYQLKNGVTTVHDDVVATPSFSDTGRVATLDVGMGSDSYTFDFDASGSPLHVFGPMTASSSGRLPARSWCWVEYAGGMLTPEILDTVTEMYALARGRR